MKRYDVVIVGGGPAGLATAIHARLLGLTVCVLERRTVPVDKACGEGLMPPGVRALDEMGARPAPLAAASFSGIRFVDGELVAVGRFVGEPGLGVRRLTLHQSLWERAAALGAELQEGCAFESLEPAPLEVTVHTTHGPRVGRYVVGADGLHSRLRHLLGLNRTSRLAARFGVRQHFTIAPWSDCVEVHWQDGVEAYVTPVASDQVGVAFLCGGEAPHFARLLTRFPALAMRLDKAHQLGAVRGAGPFSQSVSRPFSGRVALVGDAAGYVDPLTGEGLSLGFKTARALVQTIASNASLRAYASVHRRMSRAYRVMTMLLLQLAARPALRRAAFRVLAAEPQLFDRLLAITSGDEPLGDLVRHTPRFVSRLVRLHLPTQQRG